MAARKQRETEGDREKIGPSKGMPSSPFSPALPHLLKVLLPGKEALPAGDKLPLHQAMGQFVFNS